MSKKQIKLYNEEKERQKSSLEQLKLDIKESEDQIELQAKKTHEYKKLINDLQKTKEVLSYRTAEMRKSLEPKEEQIETLKDELERLEHEFEKMLKTSKT